MKQFLLLLLVIPVLFASWGLADEPATASKPEEAARRFYSELKRHHVSGLPGGEAWKSIRPMLSPALATALERAKKEQEDHKKRFPDEKPPWIEGDLFSSLFEGFQTFAVKPAKIAGETAEVPVEFVHTYEGETTRWIDTLLLKRPESGWLVDDVRYGATWDFANQGTLQEALKPEKE
jgi:hypothetical protein